jgi:hypothetical protein
MKSVTWAAGGFGFSPQFRKQINNVVATMAENYRRADQREPGVWFTTSQAFLLPLLDQFLRAHLDLLHPHRFRTGVMQTRQSYRVRPG